MTDPVVNARSTPDVDALELDVATVVVRLEQIAARRARFGDEDGLAALVWDRVVTCDLPRLREHLSPRVLKLMADL